MKLRFPESEILYYASRYPSENDAVIENLVPEVKRRGYLTKSELLEVSQWLVRARNNHRVLSNPAVDVKKMTKLALASETERHRIDYLIELHGVGLPMASVILHWFHRDDYPIWSWHSREAVLFEWSGRLPEQERWEAFVRCCREVVSRNPVDMQTLDRALRSFGESV